MELERRLRKVALYHLALFILPLLSLFYYGWWTAARLDERPDNPFRLSPMALRGSILDRDSRPLAYSPGESRQYPLGKAAGPLVGYHLRGRNQSGLEALLQSELSPPAPPKSLWGALAMDRERREGHAPLKGPDVKLTLDAPLQQALFVLLQARAGAIVVADLESGEILAAVSGPAFDPNEIGRDFQTLRADPRSPLIERVGGGLYPVRSPDGAPLLRAEESKSHPWLVDNPFPGYPGASAAVEIDGQLLLSPLMLLQMAGQTPDRKEPLRPRLLREEGEGESESEVHSWPPLRSLAGQGQQHGFTLTNLLGPPFGESPPFQVWLGRTQDQSEPGSARIAFAVVLEATRPEQEGQLREDLLLLLSSYRRAP